MLNIKPHLNKVRFKFLLYHFNILLLRKNLFYGKMFISIKIKQMAIKKSRRVAMKKLLLGLTTFLLSFTLVFSGYACSCNKQKVEPYTYITLDINPSFEIVACGETIVEIKACNQDASILLHGEHLVGLSVESASKKIAQLSQQLGFISEFSSNNLSGNCSLHV